MTRRPNLLQLFRRSRTALAIFVALMAASNSLFAQQTGTAKTLFVADYHKKLAGIVQPDNSLRWSIPINDIHDVQQLENGNWLTQTSFTNVVELSPKGEKVWEYQAGTTSSGGRIEIHAFRRLKNGLTMIAESGASRIIEIDSEKNIKHSIPLQVKQADAHRDTRLVRPTPQGNYLVAHEGEKVVKEYDRTGKVVWEYNVGSQLYSASRLSNGNTLIGTGDGHRVIEVSPDKKIVWELGQKELPNIELVWITMTERLPNGNTWIVNCHAGPQNPQILEVTPEKKVVWSFKDFDRFGNALPVAVVAQ